MRRKIGIAVGVIIAVVAIVVCLVPLKEVAYTVTVDYQDTETYYETEPYEAPLDYKVVKSYVDKDTVTHTGRISIGGVIVSEDTWEETIPVGCVTVQNTDRVSGTFTVRFSFYSKELFDREIDVPFSIKKLNLEPGEKGTAKCPAYDINMDEDEWFWSMRLPQAQRLSIDK